MAGAIVEAVTQSNTQKKNIKKITKFFLDAALYIVEHFKLPQMFNIAPKLFLKYSRLKNKINELLFIKIGPQEPEILNFEND